MTGWLLLAAATVLAGAFIQSATGFGFALVAGPALFAALAPSDAVSGVLVLGAWLNVLLLFGERRRPSVRAGDLVRLVVGSLPGLGVGLVLLAALPKPGLQVMVGVVVIAAVAVQLRAGPEAPSPRRTGGPATQLPAYPIGLVSGVLTTSTGVNGPPLVLWLRTRAGSPEELRDSVTAGLLSLNAAGLLVLAIAGGSGWPAGGAVPLAAMTALAGVGHYTGREVFVRLDAHRYDRVLLGLVALAGAASVTAGLAG